jgi:hypothetical protein
MTGLNLTLALLLSVVVKSAGQSKLNPTYGLAPPFTAEDNNHWETGAGTKVESNFVRLTPAVPNRSGYLWSRIPVTMTDWEVSFDFRITGQHPNGGDGMAFWFVEKKMLGTVFGSADYWNGLGIFFDTFNNDGRGDSPLVVAQFNDGSQKYFAYDDGVAGAQGYCAAPFRNTQQPSSAKITYVSNTLTVQIATQKSDGGQPIWTPCITINNVELGLDKFFGLTAHTGQPIVTNPPTQIQQADNHDILNIITTDLTPTSVNEAEKNRHREAYHREIETEHKMTPKHHDLTPGEFQHSALTMLHQMQESQMMLETSQMAIENLLHQLAEGDGASAGGRSTGGARSGDANVQNSLNTLLQQTQTLATNVQNQGQLLQATNQLAKAAQEAAGRGADTAAHHHMENRQVNAQTQQMHQETAANVAAAAAAGAARGGGGGGMPTIETALQQKNLQNNLAQALEEIKAVKMMLNQRTMRRRLPFSASAPS